MAFASYGYTKSLGTIDFEQAEKKIVEALKSEGFGVLTEIDVKATLKEKIDVDFGRYKILGACNPPLAHQFLSSELLIGLLLPCNVTIFEEDDGHVAVSVVNPREMFKVAENPELAGIAGQVDQKLQNVLKKL